MLKKIIYPLILKPLSTLKIVLKQINKIFKYPLYFFKEGLRLLQSLLTTLLRSSGWNIILRKVNGINFNFDFSLDPQVFDMFLGFYEIDVRNLLLRLLKKGDTFIDVGANIGFISVIGAGLVSKSGEVHSFEPVPRFFEKLSEMANMNKKYKIYVNNYALGEKYETYNLNITSLENIGWNTMVPGMMRAHTIKETIEINVKRLDDYIFENNLSKIALIKIDVEGFEYPVLKGLTNFFEKNKGNLPSIIVEVAYSAYPKLGLKLTDLENLMKKYSYRAYTLDGKHRINVKKFTMTTNVLYKPI